MQLIIFKRFIIKLSVSYLPGLHTPVESEIRQCCRSKTKKELEDSQCRASNVDRWEADRSYQWSVNGTSLSEHQQEVEAPFIKMNVLLKQTGRSKLGNVTLFKCQSSRIIDLCSTLKYGTGSSSGNRNMCNSNR